ncbi:MAG: GTP cyclohydrolase II [Candidatus Hodarchaeales archaeon]|jgi:GTP cyclohydrolase II
MVNEQESIPIPQSYLNIINKDKNHKCPPPMHHFCVRVVSAAKLPSRFGNFIAIGFHQTNDDKEHAAFVRGDVVNKENVLVRLHSECLTGDAIGSLRCDCRDQLEGALRKIEEEGEGIVLYLRQEGRGIGLTNKLKAYALQDQGMDTVEANLALGFKDDQRDYHLAGHMLKSLGVKSIRLLTNNPKKLLELQKWRVEITERVKHIYPDNPFNIQYLETKKKRSGHLLDPDLTADQFLHQQH